MPRKIHFELPSGLDPKVASVYHRANTVQAQLKASKQKAANKKRLNFFVNLSWIIIVGVLLFTGVKYALTIPAVKNFVTQAGTFLSAGRSPTVPDGTCPSLGMSVDDNNKFHVDVPQIGRCYSIPASYTEVWKTTFSDSDNVRSFVEKITADQSAQAFVTQSFLDSLTTGRLDLRQSLSDVPTLTPSLSDTPAPTDTPTPWPTYAGRDDPMVISDFVKKMQELGIRKTEGVPAGREFTWTMSYDQSAYLTLITSVGLPESCQTATQKITISLDPFEGAMQIGDGWVLCK